jgi:hypothetical protein
MEMPPERRRPEPPFEEDVFPEEWEEEYEEGLGGGVGDEHHVVLIATARRLALGRQHADDRERGVAQPNLLPDGVLAREQILGHRAAEDRDLAHRADSSSLKNVPTAARQSRIA